MNMSRSLYIFCDKNMPWIHKVLNMREYALD